MEASTLAEVPLNCTGSSLDHSLPTGATNAGAPSSEERITKAGTRGDALNAVIVGRALHQSHRLKLTGCLVWCDRCGAYAQERFKDLKRPCDGPQQAKSRAGQLAQLRKGRHPLTGRAIGATVVATGDRPDQHSAKLSASRMSSLLVPRLPVASSPRVARDAAARDARSASSSAATGRGVRRPPDIGAKALCLAVAKPIYRIVGSAFGKLV